MIKRTLLLSEWPLLFPQKLAPFLKDIPYLPWVKTRPPAYLLSRYRGMSCSKHPEHWPMHSRKPVPILIVHLLPMKTVEGQKPLRQLICRDVCERGPLHGRQDMAQIHEVALALPQHEIHKLSFIYVTFAHPGSDPFHRGA